MRAGKALAMAAVSALLCGQGMAAWGAVGAADENLVPPPRPPQAYYVPDQDDLQGLPLEAGPGEGWGWLRRIFSGKARPEPGRDDPGWREPDLDQGP